MKPRIARPALLLCNGEPPSRALARSLAKQADLLVAADGGANVARDYGLVPDVIIGDLDSIRPSTRNRFSSSTIIQLTRQDNTDLEKALDLLVARKRREVLILGATGRRLDFTLGNLSVLWKYAGRLNIVCQGDGWKAIPLKAKNRFRSPLGTTVSLIPFGRCSGITLRGLKYSLTNAVMRVGEIGVSNVVVRSPFSVQVREGHLLMVLLQRRRRKG